MRNFATWLALAVLVAAIPSRLGAAGTVATHVSLSATPLATYVSGQAIPFTATVTAGSGIPTGTLTFTVDGTALSPILMDSAHNAIVQLQFPAGTHAVQASYSGDSIFAASTSDVVAQAVSKAASLIEMPSVAAQVALPVAIRALVTVASPGSGTAGGTADFAVGAQSIPGCLGVTVVNGVATCNTSFGVAGAVIVGVTYNGDANTTGNVSSLQIPVASCLASASVSALPQQPTTGQPVTIGVLVAGVTCSVIPTGFVTILDNEGPLGAVSLDSQGRAALVVGAGAVPAFSTGTHSIGALYTGDSNYGLTKAINAAITVSGKATTTVGVTASSATIAQAVRITAALGSSNVSATFSGSVDFTNGATPIAGCSGVAVLSGSAVCNTSFPQSGTFTIIANYIGDIANLPGTGSMQLTVTKGTATASVSSAPGSPVFGGTVTFTATVTGTSGGVTPSGSVTFFDGAAAMGASTLGVNGQATLTAPSGTLPVLSAGTHTIAVSYGGDANYSSVASNPIAVVVTRPGTTVTVTATPAQIGQPVKITATIQGNSPSGTVDFSSGAAAISGCTGVAVVGGAAICNTSFPQVGTVTVGASYGGDSNNPGSTGALQFAVAKCSAGVYVASSPESPVYGSAVTLGMLVLGAAGVANPTGSVIFSEGATALGTAQIGADGHGALVAPSGTLAALSSGTHIITAVYSGDANYLTATAAPMTVTVAKVTPTVTIGMTPGSPKPGQSVSITAAIAPAGLGSVAFLNGAAPITGCGAIGLVNGTATCPTTFPQAGSVTLVANYAGDANSSAVSGSLLVTVAELKSTQVVTLTSTPSAPVFGAAMSLNVTVPAGTGVPPPTGTVVFSDGALVLGTVPLNATGQASLAAPGATPYPAAGTHSIGAVYSGDSNYAGASATVLPLTVTKASTNTALTAPYGGPFTAVVTVTLPGSGTPTGQVQFTNSGTVLGVGALQQQGTSLVATWQRNTLTGTVTAAYLGDSNFGGSISLPATLSGPKAQATLGSNRNPSTFGDSVAFTVFVVNNSGPGTPTGSVQLLADGVSVGTATLASGVASFSTASLSIGTHAMVANYAGDSTYPATTATLSQVVNKAAATISLGSSSPAAVFGQPLTFTAQFSAASSTATVGGQVQFLDGAVSLGTAPMTANAATLKIANLTPGAHSITASWSGDGGWAPTTSSPLVQVVGRAQTTTTLTSKGSGVGGTLTATVGVIAPGAGVPTGNVNFVNGTTNAVLATVPLTGLSAGIPLLTVTDPIVAIYSGDGNFQDSTSVALVQVTATNSASYATLNLAPDEIVTLFGSNLGSATNFASPPSDALAGTTVKVRDSAGVIRPAQIFYVSPSQASILMPAGVALGAGTLTLTTTGQTPVVVNVTIGAVSPGLYTANASGQGVAAAQVVVAHADGTQDAPQNVAVFDSQQNVWVTSPVSLGSPSDSAFLLLYGTGLRHYARLPTCTINGNSISVQYAGAQGTFAGLDQVNILLPSSLRGRGTVTVVLTVDGIQANPVTVAIQ